MIVGRYALIDAGVVVDIVLWDYKANPNWKPEFGVVLLEGSEDRTVTIGCLFDSKTWRFSRADQAPRDPARIAALGESPAGVEAPPSHASDPCSFEEHGRRLDAMAAELRELRELVLSGRRG